MKKFDVKSFIIGVLLTLLLVVMAGATSDVFNQTEIARLKRIATYIQDDGNLNLGKQKIIMQGSTIYDDSSEGGGLILRGGANRVNIHGNAIMYDNPEFRRDTISLNTNLDMGNKKIIMLGSKIYDDGTEGGGLQLRGGANRIHFFGKTIPH
ncbi:MAG: hypothetical protein ABSE05_16510 [Syntrophales bacterium]|jgi:hypothetical protein